MKYPKHIINTGKTLTWLKENNQEIYNNWNKTKKDQGYPGWKYECLERTEKLMQTPLSLGQFVPYKDGKVLKEPEKYKDWLEEPIKNGHYPVGINCEQYQQSCKEIWFEDFVIIEGTNMFHLNKPNHSNKYEVAYIKKEYPMNDLNIILKKKTIEQLITKIDIKGAGAFWNMIFKL